MRTLAVAKHSNYIKNFNIDLRNSKTWFLLKRDENQNMRKT